MEVPNRNQFIELIGDTSAQIDEAINMTVQLCLQVQITNRNFSMKMMKLRRSSMHHEITIDESKFIFIFIFTFITSHDDP